MQRALQSLLVLLCLVAASIVTPAYGGDSVLTAVPPDAVCFVVIHDVTDVCHTIGDLAKLVNAPAPDLLSMLKSMIGLQKGVDENGDVAVILTSVDPPKTAVLVPIANFDDFFGSLNVKEPASGLADAQLVGQAIVVGRKGNFAALARQADRDALEQYLAATENLASDAALAAWLDANKMSVVVTPRGMKQLVPKFLDSVRSAEARRQQIQGAAAKPPIDVVKIYADLFGAAEPEVEQYACGLHVDNLHNIDLINRIRFKPDGNWAHWAATLQPSNDDLLAGLPADPFFMVFGGAIPLGGREKFYEFFTQMMQSNSQLNLSSEDAKQYAELSAPASHDVHSVRAFIGAPQAGASLFSNAIYIATLDDTAGYLDRYEKRLAALHEFTAKLNNPKLPSSTSQRVTVDGVEALEISTVMPDPQNAARPGGPDPQKIRQLFFGDDNTLKIYVSPVDEHTIIMAYTSSESLKTAIDFYKSQQPGLSGDPRVSAVSVMLPLDAQAIGYFDLASAFALGKQMMPVIPGARMPMLPDLVRSPPLGMAAKIAPEGLETHLVLSAETLQSIGAAVAESRAAR